MAMNLAVNLTNGRYVSCCLNLSLQILLVSHLLPSEVAVLEFEGALKIQKCYETVKSFTYLVQVEYV